MVKQIYPLHIGKKHFFPWFKVGFFYLPKCYMYKFFVMYLCFSSTLLHSFIASPFLPAPHQQLVKYSCSYSSHKPDRSGWRRHTFAISSSSYYFLTGIYCCSEGLLGRVHLQATVEIFMSILTHQTHGR